MVEIAYHMKERQQQKFIILLSCYLVTDCTTSSQAYGFSKKENLPPAPKSSRIRPTHQLNLVFHSSPGGANHSQVRPCFPTLGTDLTEYGHQLQCFCSRASLSRPRNPILSFQQSDEIPPPFQRLWNFGHHCLPHLPFKQIT